jgi:hypothetical protein
VLNIWINSKHEARHGVKPALTTKYETISNDKNVKYETNFMSFFVEASRIGKFGFVSIFDIRILNVLEQ